MFVPGTGHFVGDVIHRPTKAPTKGSKENLEDEILHFSVFVSLPLTSGVATVGVVDPNGPNWTKMGLFWTTRGLGIRSEIIYAPPPPHFFNQKRFFREGMGGIFQTPRGRNFIVPPPLLYTPHPRRVFSRVGGWGRIKFGPVETEPEFQRHDSDSLNQDCGEVAQWKAAH